MNLKFVARDAKIHRRHTHTQTNTHKVVYGAHTHTQTYGIKDAYSALCRLHSTNAEASFLLSCCCCWRFRCFLLPLAHRFIKRRRSDSSAAIFSAVRATRHAHTPLTVAKSQPWQSAVLRLLLLPFIYILF